MASEVSPRPLRTRDRILDRAEEMFAERGYRGTSLSEIADHVGIRGPSLFSHFKSKRALYEATLERLLDPFFALLDDLSELPDQGDRTATTLARLMQHNAAHPRLSALIQQAALEGGEQLDLLVDRWYRPYAEAISDVLSPKPSAAGRGAAGASRDDSTERTIAFNALILGYFSLAPLHAKLMRVDPLAPGAVDAHVRLLQRIDEALREG